MSATASFTPLIKLTWVIERSLERMFFDAGSHDIDAEDFSLLTKPIVIGRCVWIATGATVLPGVHIGDGAVVGAMAVVSKDVPPRAVVVGNPAQVVRTDRPIADSYDPLSLTTIDYMASLVRLRRWISRNPEDAL